MGYFERVWHQWRIIFFLAALAMISCPHKTQRKGNMSHIFHECGFEIIDHLSYSPDLVPKVVEKKELWLVRDLTTTMMSWKSSMPFFSSIERIFCSGLVVRCCSWRQCEELRQDCVYKIADGEILLLHLY